MDYIEWDGTEQCLQKMLVWWAQPEHYKGGTFRHAKDCEEDGRAMDCCFGDPDCMYPSSLESSTHSFSLDYPQDIPLYFRRTPDEDSQIVEIGDRIVFREFTGFYLLPRLDDLEFNDYEDSFIIKDRGYCFSSSRWKLPEGFWEPWDLTGYQARINGIEVKIKGVDAFASSRSPSNPYRHSFALMVSEEEGKLIRGET